jgi:hypothetical protein
MTDTVFVAKNGIVANTSFVANSTGIYFNNINSTSNGIFANGSVISVGNSSVNVSVNSTNFTGTSNNSSYLGGTIASSYQTTAGLASNVATLTANNSTYFNGQSASYYQTNIGLASNVATLTSNNTSYVGSVSAANVVSNNQLQSNLSSYQTNAGLAANVAILSSNNSTYFNGQPASYYQTTAGLAANVLSLTSNNTSYVGSVSAANVVSNNQLQSNLSNYQTLAGLSSNVAILSSNNSTYFNGQPASYYQTNGGLASNVALLTANNSNYLGGISYSSYVNTSQLSANLNNYQTTAGLASNVATLISNNTSYVGSVSAANVVSNAQLQANLSNYAALSGATFTGDVYIYRSGAPTTGVLYLNNSGTRYIYYDGSNYQLSGTNLYVNGSLALTYSNYNSYAPTLTGTGASGTWSINITGGSNSSVYANQSITNTFTIGTAAYHVSNGNMGIGTSSPGTKLQIANGSIGLSDGYGYTWGSTYISGYSGNYMSFTTNASERMRIDSSGNVGIGTSSPSYLLDVNGASRVGGLAFSLTGGDQYLYDSGSGGATIRTGSGGSDSYFTFYANGTFQLLNGGLKFSDGSIQSTAAISPTTAGAVGTYAFAVPMTSTVTFGTNIAGSYLYSSDSTGYGGTTLSGTWKCMGASYGENPTLWLRIA